HLWRAGYGTGRETCNERVECAAILAQFTLDVGNNVHDLAVTLDEELFGNSDAANFGDPPYIVTAKIEQHQVLGALLGIGEEFGFERLILAWRGAAGAGASNRTDRHAATGGLHHDLRTGSGDCKSAEIEKIKIRRWIDAAQSAIKRKRRQRERQRETLRQDDLKNISGGDILLSAHHHALVFRGRGV